MYMLAMACTFFYPVGESMCIVIKVVPLFKAVLWEYKIWPYIKAGYPLARVVIIGVPLLYQQYTCGTVDLVYSGHGYIVAIRI